MRTIHVRIGHDDDAVITQFVDIVFVAANATAQRGDQGAHFLRRQHLVETGFFHVQNFTLERQNRLILAIPTLFGRAPRRITLHNIEFGERRVFLLAVRQLSGQASDIQGPFAPRHFTGFTGGIAGAGRIDDFLYNTARFARVFQQVILEKIAHGLLHRTFHLGGDQLVLGLAGKLGIRYFHRNHRRQAFPCIIPRRVGFFLFQEAFLVHIAVQGTGQRRPETGQVRAAIALGNIVGKAENVFLIGIIPLHGHFHRNTVFLPLKIEVEDLVEGGFVGIQVADKSTQPALILEHIFIAAALIHQVDTHPGVQKAQLTQPLGEDIVVELDIAEGFRGRAEMHSGTAGIRRSHHFQGVGGHTVVINLLVNLTITANCQLQFFRQGVHHRHAHTVQATGHLVGVVVELTAGVQHRHDHFGSAHAFFFVQLGRNTTAIILDGHGFIRVDNHFDLGAKPGKRFIDGVIHDLKHHMMQARAIICITDIHAGTFTYGIQSFQHLDAG